MSRWPSVQIRHVARFAYGDSLAGDDRIEGPVPVFGSNGAVGTHDKANTRGPVLVIGRKGSHGKVQYSADPVFAIDTTFFVDGSTSSQDLRWLYYVLSTVGLDGLSQDVGVPGLSREVAYRERVRLPSLREQRAIAAFLDAETARIDALINKKRRLIELLGNRWRTAVDQTMRRLSLEHGTIQLRHLVRCLDGRRIPLSGEERSHRSGPYPYYGASGIVGYLDGYLFDDVLVLLGEDGAQLGDPSYPIAQVVGGKIWVNNHAHVLRPVRADPAFLAFRLNTFDRVPFMSGGTREKITQDDMNRIPVPHLARELQVQVGEELSAIRVACDTAASQISRQIDLLVEHRQALITAAVTGDLPVPGVAA